MMISIIVIPKRFFFVGIFEFINRLPRLYEHCVATMINQQIRFSVTLKIKYLFVQLCHVVRVHIHTQHRHMTVFFFSQTLSARQQCIFHSPLRIQTLFFKNTLIHIKAKRSGLQFIYDRACSFTKLNHTVLKKKKKFHSSKLILIVY